MILRQLKHSARKRLIGKQTEFLQKGSSEQEIKDFIDLYVAKDNTVLSDHDLSNILNANITVEEVCAAVKKLKPGKSPGLDGIPVEFIKSSVDIIKHDLTSIFNYILSSETFPDTWCQGLRVAIPKGDSDIRPITIEPLFAKVFETILDQRVCFLNEAFSKGDRFNGGFVKGSMIQDNLLIIDSCIKKQLASGKSIYLA